MSGESAFVLAERILCDSPDTIVSDEALVGDSVGSSRIPTPHPIH